MGKIMVFFLGHTHTITSLYVAISSFFSAQIRYFGSIAPHTLILDLLLGISTSILNRNIKLRLERMEVSPKYLRNKVKILAGPTENPNIRNSRNSGRQRIFVSHLYTTLRNVYFCRKVFLCSTNCCNCIQHQHPNLLREVVARIDFPKGGNNLNEYTGRGGQVREINS